MKSLIVFNTDKLTDFVKNRLSIMHKEVNSDKFDIFIQLPKYIDCSSIEEYIDGKIQYEGTILATLNCSKGYGLPNLVKPLSDNFLQHKDNYSKYKNFYIIDYSVYCNKSWNELFSFLDKNEYDNIDLLMNGIKFSEDDSWMWTSIYKTNDEIIKDPNFKRLLCSYNGGVIRLSKKALDFYASYNVSNVKEYFIDFALPNVLYNYGYNVKSLSYVNDKTFDAFTICKNNSFYYGNTPIPKKEMNAKFTDLTLFNNYNESIGIEYDHKIDNPEVSIVIYANGKNENTSNVKECLDSVLTQTVEVDYEVLLIDDSQGNVIKDFIVNNHYNDIKNFMYIKTTEYGFANGINHGIFNSLGQYIMILNAYDVLEPFAIKENISFVKNSSTPIDCIYNVVLDEQGLYEDFEDQKLLSYQELRNCLLNSYEGLFISRNALMNILPYPFEEYYVNYETYALLFNLLFNNVKVNLRRTIVCTKSSIQYNENFENLTNEAYHRVNKLIQYAINPNEFTESKNLTIIVSFKNEKHEVEKTVSSIRATTTNVPIIVVNDGSNDEYDYYNRLKKYKVKYLENVTSSGVAGARENAISLLKTDYFMILDGHMRFYESNWEDRLLSIINDGHHENDILCAQTRCFWVREKNLYNNEIGVENSKCFGATLDDKTYTNNPNWTWKCCDESLKNDNVVPIPCILGACYIISVNHWKKIGGLTGLLQWGQDEPLLSIKTWLSGHKCCVIRDFSVGHLYRDATPYNRNFADMNSNYIYVNYLFYEGEKLQQKLAQLKKYFGDRGYTLAYQSFMKRKDKFDAFKKYFDVKVKVKPIEFFDNLNERCKQ